MPATRVVGGSDVLPQCLTTRATSVRWVLPFCLPAQGSNPDSECERSELCAFATTRQSGAAEPEKTEVDSPPLRFVPEIEDPCVMSPSKTRQAALVLRAQWMVVRKLPRGQQRTRERIGEGPPAHPPTRSRYRLDSKIIRKAKSGDGGGNHNA